MSGILFVYPRQMPFYNGAPMPGGKLIFTATGTSTPQDVFTTTALNVPHANPVVADSQGIWPPIFTDPTLVYRVTLTDANDVQVGAPVDGINADPADYARLSQSNTFGPAGECTILVGEDASTSPASGRSVIEIKGSSSALFSLTGSGDNAYLYNDASSFHLGTNDTTRIQIGLSAGTLGLANMSLTDAADDAAAASGGVAIGQVYRTGSALKIRIA